jgi:membrane carboxypeptidase/penicillin-binding protein PbpC
MTATADKADGHRPARRRLAAIFVGAVLCLAIVSAFGWWIVALGPAPDGRDLRFSPRVTDRNGRLLRAYTTNDGRWRLPARSADVDPRFFDILFANITVSIRWRSSALPSSSLTAAAFAPAVRR